MVEIDELTDAIIEDSFPCKLCGQTICCGGNDCLISERGWGICVECAAEAARLYEESLRDAGLCEHGVNDGDWCPECSAEYKRAAKVYGKEPTP